MRFTPILLSAAALVVATPAVAQDAAASGPTAPPSAFTVTGGATLVTDYRFRGISQSDKHVAIQGTFTVSHQSGFYATVWSSSIDDYVANGGDAEVDLIAGYKHAFGGTTIDGGVLYYYYPGSGGANTDFVEPYISLSHTLGPVSAKVTANYAPKSHALYAGRVNHPREDNLYLAGDLSFGVPHTPVSVTGHLGHTFGPSYLSIGKEYTDWNVGATYVWKALTFGVSYVGTNKDVYVARGGHLRDESKDGIVGSVGVSF